MLPLLSFSTYNDCNLFIGMTATLKPNNFTAVPHSLQTSSYQTPEHWVCGQPLRASAPLCPIGSVAGQKDSVQLANKCCPQHEGDASAHHPTKQVSNICIPELSNLGHLNRSINSDLSSFLHLPSGRERGRGQGEERNFPGRKQLMLFWKQQNTNNYLISLVGVWEKMQEPN